MLKSCLLGVLICGCAAQGSLRASSKAPAPMIWDLASLLLSHWPAEKQAGSGMQGFLARAPLAAPVPDSLELFGNYKAPSMLSNESEIDDEVDTTTPFAELYSADVAVMAEETTPTTTPMAVARSEIGTPIPSAYTETTTPTPRYLAPERRTVPVQKEQKPVEAPKAQPRTSVKAAKQVQKQKEPQPPKQPQQKGGSVENAKRMPRLSWTTSSTAPPSTIKRYQASQGQSVQKGHGGYKNTQQRGTRKEAFANNGARSPSSAAMGSRKGRDRSDL